MATGRVKEGRGCELGEGRGKGDKEKSVRDGRVYFRGVGGIRGGGRDDYIDEGGS